MRLQVHDQHATRSRCQRKDKIVAHSYQEFQGWQIRCSTECSTSGDSRYSQPQHESGSGELVGNHANLQSSNLFRHRQQTMRVQDIEHETCCTLALLYLGCAQVVAALKCADDVLGVAPQTTTLFRLEASWVLGTSVTETLISGFCPALGL